MSFTYRFDDAVPDDWSAFLARIERAVSRGDLAANTGAAERERARRRVAQERESERLAWEHAEQARIDAAKRAADPARPGRISARIARLFG